ncbi:AraC family transcriptional regulator [Salinisphaera sp.]|uniref:helix-turn-helix domain-containing protein n=1 Tax=Salinisphaera sp. TaxID=1914330 RepID=UPI000C48F0C0|nr:AraC family transcriptional regulator [Salinisphaera sp.]MBS61532.1 hypothetical protein [Salinisphaera sp.]
MHRIDTRDWNSSQTLGENIRLSPCVFDGNVHVHQQHQLVIPLNAPIEFEADGECGQADLFKAVMFSKGTRHSFNVPIGGSFLIIDLPYGDTRFTRDSTRGAQTIVLTSHATRFIRYLAREAEFNRSVLLAIIRPSIDILAATLVQPVAPRGRYGDRRMARLNHAHNRLLDPTCNSSIASVARDHGFSHANFRRLFRRKYGSSPQAAVTRARVDHARAILEQTDQSVTSIALSFGYQNVSSFIDLFERHTELTPTAYRFRPRRNERPAQSR